MMPGTPESSNMSTGVAYVTKKFSRSTKGQVSETTGMMSGSSGELENAYVTGLRDGKVKVIQGQMSETTGNVSGPLGKLTKLPNMVRIGSKVSHFLAAELAGCEAVTAQTALVPI